LLKDFKLSKLKELGYKNYIDDFFHLAYYTQKEFSDLNGWEMINLQ
jgi:hypothetical protein